MLHAGRLQRHDTGHACSYQTNRVYDVQVYLIEVNTSPALYRHGQVLTDLLPVLIEEVVQKVRYHVLRHEVHS